MAGLRRIWMLLWPLGLLLCVVACVCSWQVRRQNLGVQLVAAADRGDLARVRELVAEGADVRTAREPYTGATALMRAAQSHQMDAVRFLLRAGADPNTAAYDGTTVLSMLDPPRAYREIIGELRRAGARR